MTKGRRLTTSRSDRLLGLDHYGRSNHGHGSHMSEFMEEDVWSTIDNISNQNQHLHCCKDTWTTRSTVEGVTWREVTCHDARGHVGGLSRAFDDKTTSSRRAVHQYSTVKGGPRGDRQVATSAPVKVPDWNKILRVNSVELIREPDEYDWVGDSGGVEPPHEYLARSRKMNTMSVFEGVGRTLKGRDMSRVRNTVWNQTGFEG